MLSSKRPHSDRCFQQIQLVNKTYADLAELDKRLAIPATIAIYFWIRSAAGMIELSLATGFGVYALASTIKERQMAAKNFKEALANLAVSFQEMTAVGIEIVHDEMYLSALETLAPFIASTDDLLPKNFKETAANDLPAKFIAILAQAPHQIAFLSHLNQQRYEPSFFSRISGYFTAAPAPQNITIKASPMHQELLARSRLSLYGFQSLQDLKLRENPSIQESALRLLTLS